MDPAPRIAALQICHRDGTIEPVTHLADLRIRHPDGRLEPVVPFTARLRGSVLESLRSSLPPGAELLEPGEHRPATMHRAPPTVLHD